MKEKTQENGFSMLLKFGSEENVRKLKDGQLYMKNLQYYVDLEKATSDEDVGDMYEGQMLLQTTNISIYSSDTNELVGQFLAPSASMDLGYLKCPVFCMFMLDYRNHTQEKLDGDILTVRYEFTKKQIENMPGFGEWVLLIKNGDEFINRVKKALILENVGFTRDYVKYYEVSTLQQLQEIHEDNLRIAFWKREKYAYQQEYRFICHAEVDDNLIVNIGDISDISQMMKTEELLNTYIDVRFVVKEPIKNK